MARPMPMFPLGSVLLPGMGLPLHVFEPRYRSLVEHCLAGDREFGVVLIERGSEVGGGEVRTDVGTVAEIVEARQIADGRWAVGAVGIRRARVVDWLVDDPYPRAVLEDWPDTAEVPEVERVAEVAVALRRVLALASELGEPVAPVTFPLAGDQIQAVAQMAVVAPLGPVDRQSLLLAPGPGARLELLAEILRDQTEMLEARVAMADLDDDIGEGYGGEPGGL